MSLARPSPIGVLTQPVTALRSAVGHGQWKATLLLTAAVSALATGGFGSTDTGALAFIDRWESTAYAFGHELTEVEYAELGQRAEHAGVLSATVWLLGVPAVTVTIALLIRLVYGGAGGRTFGQVLAVTAQAGMVLALRQAVAAPVAWIRETGANPLALGAWLPLEAGTPVAYVMALVDPFVVWWVVVLAIGVSVLYGRRLRPLAVRFAGVYAGLVLLTALAIAAIGRG